MLKESLVKIRNLENKIARAIELLGLIENALSEDYRTWDYHLEKLVPQADLDKIISIKSDLIHLERYVKKKYAQIVTWDVKRKLHELKVDNWKVKAISPEEKEKYSSIQNSLDEFAFTLRENRKSIKEF